MNDNTTAEKSLNQGTNHSGKGIALAVLGASLWGVMGVFIRALGGVGYTSLDVSFVRCLFAGVGFFIVKACTEATALRIDSKGLCICFLYGILGYAMGFVGYGVAVERIPVAVTTILSFMSPIWVAVLSVLVFKERLQTMTAVIIFVCFLGASMVANVWGTTDMKLDWFGLFAGALNGIGVAFQIMIPRYFAKQYERDTMLVYGFLGAAIGLGFFTNFQTIVQSVTGENSIYVICNLFGIGILCTMVANVAVVKAGQYISSTTCSILLALEVVVGTVVGYFLFAENLNLMQCIGAIIVVCGALGSTLYKSAPQTEN